LNREGSERGADGLSDIVAVLNNQDIRRFVGETHDLIVVFAQVVQSHRLKSGGSLE